MTRRTMVVAAGLLACVAGTAQAVDVNALPDGTARLVRQLPDLQVILDQGRVRTIAGAVMARGATPEAAAANFMAWHGDAFGVPNLDLRPLWTSTLSDGKRNVFAYQQYIAGLPVEYGIARILTVPGPEGGAQVTYAAGRLAPIDQAGLPMAVVPADMAVARMKAERKYRDLPDWSAPEQVVWQGEGQWVTPAIAWKFTAERQLEDRDHPGKRERFTFFVSARTSEVLFVRDEVVHVDVAGVVQAKATPGMLPDTVSNLPTIQPMPEIRIGVTGDLPVYTDRNGNFSLFTGGSSQVQLTTAVGPGDGSGLWGWVKNTGGNELVLTPNATPPSAPPIIFNNTPSEITTAQVNAFIHTNKIHNFYRDRSGTWDLIDVSIKINTNIADTCNAFFDGSSINFFKAGGGCPNTAYSDVVGHEYGHFVVNQLGLGQGGFGEGFADSGSLLSYDVINLGAGFNGPGSFARRPLTDNVQYPCSSSTLCQNEVHCCGEILGAVWIRIRQNMGTKYGSAPGLTKTQQLFVDWMQISTGGTGGSFNNSANENTAIEVLTINDNDGDLVNGTPDYGPITRAFKAQSVPVPPAPPLQFTFPNGLPGLIAPNTPVTIAMVVDEMSRLPQANTGKITYRFNNGSYTTVNMTQTTVNNYTVTIPAQACDTIVDYYFTATAAASTNPNLPALPTNFPDTAPETALYYPVAESINTVTQDNMEFDSGWVSGDPEDTAITGQWIRDIPQETEAQPGTDHTPNGTRCWATDVRGGQQVSDYDVDGGKTTLFSPVFNIQGLHHPRATFWLWFSNDVGPSNPNTSIFHIDITSNGGNAWTPLKTIGPTGSLTHGKWRFFDIAIDAPVAYTNQMQLRFVANDITDSIVEAAIDDYAITSLVCNFPCYANCDESTTAPVLNINDYQCFLNRFAAGESWANCDGSVVAPVLNVNDFQCFVNQFAIGCP